MAEIGKIGKGIIRKLSNSWFQNSQPQQAGSSSRPIFVRDLHSNKKDLFELNKDSDSDISNVRGTFNLINPKSKLEPNNRSSYNGNPD